MKISAPFVSLNHTCVALKVLLWSDKKCTVSIWVKKYKKTSNKYLLAALLLLSSCNRYIETNRNHFVQQGEDIPTPDVGHYKSPQLRAGQNADIGVVVAISGGGARAANFGMGILMALEELDLPKHSNVLNEIDCDM